MPLAAIRDLWRRVIAAQIEEKPEPIGKTENRIEYQIRKPVNSFRGKRKLNAKIRKMRKPQRTPKPKNRSFLAQKPNNRFKI